MDKKIGGGYRLDRKLEAQLQKQSVEPKPSKPPTREGKDEDKSYQVRPLDV